VLAWLESPARCPIPWQFFAVSLALHLIAALLVPGVVSNLRAQRILSVELLRPAPALAARLSPPPPEALPAALPPPLPQKAQLRKQEPRNPGSPKQQIAPVPPASSQSASSDSPAPPLPAAAPAAPVGASAAGGDLVPAGSPGGSPGGVPGGVPGGSPQGVPGGVPGGRPDGVPGGQGDGKPAPLTPPVKKAEPKPLPAGPTEAEIKELSDEYKSGVKSAILANKSYPEMAQRLQHTGKVGLLIRISADGSLESVSVSSSSGYDELDEAALDAVRAAAPFDAFPEGIGKSVIKFGYSLRFSL